jgi:2-dehydropantoate 2-reductase
MRVLVVGAGLIGTVYGAHLAAAGNTVSVLSHGPRTGDVAAEGLCARDVLSGGRADAEAAVVPDASGEYDIVLVAVRRDQLASACAGLAVLAGEPAIVFFGNNPAGRAAIAGELPGDVYLGFPGVGGVMTSGLPATSGYGSSRRLCRGHLIPGWQRWNRRCPAAGSLSGG